MELIFYTAVFLILYIYIGYPLLLTLLSVIFGKRAQLKDIEPSVTFLISAYNEARSMREKIENTLGLDYPKDKFEILVASDASSDGTDSIVKEYAKYGVKLFRQENRLGKTELQNAAVKKAKGEIIVFSDATTKYEEDAIRKLVRNYADEKTGAVSGRYKYLNPKRTQIGKGAIAFWDYENFIKSRQSKILTITGCCGCIYSVRKKLYVPLPKDIISDLVEPLKILEQGFRIVFEPQAIAYEDACLGSEEEFKMRVRVISRGMRGLLYMRKLFNPFSYGFIAFQLFSHKVLRWLIPLFLAALYISSAFLSGKGFIYAAAFLAQTVFYLIALAGFAFEFFNKKIKVFSLPLFFCVVNAASIAALIKTIKGKKDIVWETIR